MRLPECVIRWLHRRAVRIVKGRPADFVIAPKGTPYLRRWHLLPRNRLLNVYLHHILEDDDARALHDHPWWNCSVLLAGGYWEVTFKHPDLAHVGATETVATLRLSGEVVTRRARDAHRLAIHRGGCWSLFITGPRLRSWGFILSDGTWVHHSDYARVMDGVSTLVQ